MEGAALQAGRPASGHGGRISRPDTQAARIPGAGRARFFDWAGSRKAAWSTRAHTRAAVVLDPTPPSSTAPLFQLAPAAASLLDHLARWAVLPPVSPSTLRGPVQKLIDSLMTS